MKLVVESWREFVQEAATEAALLKEVKSVCASYKKGTLKPQSLNEQQFLEQLGELYVLYEQGGVSRRGFLKGLGALAATAALPAGLAVAEIGQLSYEALFTALGIPLSRKDPRIDAGIVRSMIELWRNYGQMKEANTRQSDKYFHCLGHCLASRERWGGKTMSHFLGWAREVTDVIRKGDTQMAVDADLFANNFGRLAAAGGTCGDCWKFIPNGLPEKYWILPPGVNIATARKKVYQNTECNPEFMGLQGIEIDQERCAQGVYSRATRTGARKTSV
jgi:hypothetical protein